jgi:hypothetical protein
MGSSFSFFSVYSIAHRGILLATHTNKKVKNQGDRRHIDEKVNKIYRFNVIFLFSEVRNPLR